MTQPTPPVEVRHLDGHAGQQAVAALMAFGTDTMFTLNGGHIWPLYDAARDRGMKVIDTRHEQTATFAAEAYAKLDRSEEERRVYERFLPRVTDDGERATAQLKLKNALPQKFLPKKIPNNALTFLRNFLQKMDIHGNMLTIWSMQMITS